MGGGGGRGGGGPLKEGKKKNWQLDPSFVALATAMTLPVRIVLCPLFACVHRLRAQRESCFSENVPLGLKEKGYLI